MRMFWLPLVLACQPPSAALPTPRNGPPLTLSASPLIPGQVVTLRAEGADPFDTIWFLRGNRIGPGICSPFIGGQCLDIRNHVPVSSVVADAQGVAELVFTLPDTVPVGLTVAMQALHADGGASYLSPSIAETIVPAPPVLEGEVTAGHDDPSWRWSSPLSVVRVRLDGGPWLTQSASTRIYTASGLAPGPHTLEVQALDGSTWSPSASWTTVIRYFSKEGAWDGFSRDFARSPSGRWVPVSCHNCYTTGSSSPADNLANTLDQLHDAIQAGADLLELDVKQEGGVWRVDHDDNGDDNGALLVDVLDDPVLRAADAPLFIEIKEDNPTLAGTEELVDMLLDAGFATNGRPVVLRAFEGNRTASLGFANQLLTVQDHPLHYRYFRTHVLYGSGSGSSAAALQSRFDDALADGFTGVEVDHRIDEILGMSTYAASLGLAFGVWTIPNSFGEVYCASLRHDVDAITTDYSVAGCREAIEDRTSLAYVQTWASDAGGLVVPILRDGIPFTIGPVNSGQGPGLLYDGPGEDRFGTSMVFDGTQHLTLGDLDNEPDEGFFVAAYVNFDDLALAAGETQAILNKSDAGGFALELHADVANQPYLRFGVHVNGAYRYATHTGALNGSDGYFIVGAYDGDGGVRMWVDWSQGSTGGNHVGGATLNDSPIVLGADPQGVGAYRFHFQGKIQMAMVQTWGDH